MSAGPIRRRRSSAPMPPKFVLGCWIGQSSFEIRETRGARRDVLLRSAAVEDRRRDPAVRPAAKPSTVYHMEQVGLNAAAWRCCYRRSAWCWPIRGRSNCASSARRCSWSTCSASRFRELDPDHPIIIAGCWLLHRPDRHHEGERGGRCRPSARIRWRSWCCQGHLLVVRATLPLLAVGGVVALAGGAIMSYFVLDLTFGQFLTQLRGTPSGSSSCGSGAVKAPPLRLRDLHARLATRRSVRQRRERDGDDHQVGGRGRSSWSSCSTRSSQSSS